MPRRARILFNYQNVIDCIIQDISGTGAALDVSSSLTIPSTFDLITDHGDAYVCRVIRKNESRLEVLFQHSVCDQDTTT